jgi:hypothetical protein
MLRWTSSPGKTIGMRSEYNAARFSRRALATWTELTTMWCWPSVGTYSSAPAPYRRDHISKRRHGLTDVSSMSMVAPRTVHPSRRTWREASSPSSSEHAAMGERGDKQQRERVEHFLQ